MPRSKASTTATSKKGLLDGLPKPSHTLDDFWSKDAAKKPIPTSASESRKENTSRLRKRRAHEDQDLESTREAGPSSSKRRASGQGIGSGRSPLANRDAEGTRSSPIDPNSTDIPTTNVSNTAYDTPAATRTKHDTTTIPTPPSSGLPKPRPRFAPPPPPTHKLASFKPRTAPFLHNNSQTTPFLTKQRTHGIHLPTPTTVSRNSTSSLRRTQSIHPDDDDNVEVISDSDPSDDDRGHRKRKSSSLFAPGRPRRTSRAHATVNTSLAYGRPPMSQTLVPSSQARERDEEKDEMINAMKTTTIVSPLGIMTDKRGNFEMLPSQSPRAGSNTGPTPSHTMFPYSRQPQPMPGGFEDTLMTKEVPSSQSQPLVLSAVNFPSDECEPSSDPPELHQEMGFDTTDVDFVPSSQSQTFPDLFPSLRRRDHESSWDDLLTHTGINQDAEMESADVNFGGEATEDGRDIVIPSSQDVDKEEDLCATFMAFSPSRKLTLEKGRRTEDERSLFPSSRPTDPASLVFQTPKKPGPPCNDLSDLSPLTPESTTYPWDVWPAKGEEATSPSRAQRASPRTANKTGAPSVALAHMASFEAAQSIPSKTSLLSQTHGSEAEVRLGSQPAPYSQTQIHTQLPLSDPPSQTQSDFDYDTDIVYRTHTVKNLVGAMAPPQLEWRAKPKNREDEETQFSLTELTPPNEEAPDDDEDRNGENDEMDLDDRAEAFMPSSQTEPDFDYDPLPHRPFKLPAPRAVLMHGPASQESVAVESQSQSEVDDNDDDFRRTEPAVFFSNREKSGWGVAPVPATPRRPLPSRQHPIKELEDELGPGSYLWPDSPQKPAFLFENTPQHLIDLSPPPNRSAHRARNYSVGGLGPSDVDMTPRSRLRKMLQTFDDEGDGSLPADWPDSLRF